MALILLQYWRKKTEVVCATNEDLGLPPNAHSSDIFYIQPLLASSGIVPAFGSGLRVWYNMSAQVCIGFTYSCCKLCLGVRRVGTEEGVRSPSGLPLTGLRTLLCTRGNRVKSIGSEFNTIGLTLAFGHLKYFRTKLTWLFTSVCVFF